MCIPQKSSIRDLAAAPRNNCETAKVALSCESDSKSWPGTNWHLVDRRFVEAAIQTLRDRASEWTRSTPAARLR